MTKQGNTVRRAFNRIKNLSKSCLLKNCSKLQEISYSKLFSSVTWELTDCNFTFYNNKYFASTSKVNPVISFCKALKYEQQHNRNIYLYDLQNNLTDLGIITLIDMIESAEFWLDFGFNPIDLEGLLLEEFNRTRSIFQYFRKGDSAYNIFIFRTHLTFGSNFLKVLSLLENKDLNQHLDFFRNNKTQFLGLVNKKTGRKIQNTLTFTILQTFFGEIEIHPNFDVVEHKNSFDNLVLLLISGDHNSILNLFLELLAQSPNPNEKLKNKAINQEPRITTFEDSSISCAI